MKAAAAAGMIHGIGNTRIIHASITQHPLLINKDMSTPLFLALYEKGDKKRTA